MQPWLCWGRTKKWGRGGSFPSPKGEEDPVEWCWYRNSRPRIRKNHRFLGGYGNRMRWCCQGVHGRCPERQRSCAGVRKLSRIVRCGMAGTDGQGTRLRRADGPRHPHAGRCGNRDTLRGKRCAARVVTGTPCGARGALRAYAPTNTDEDTRARTITDIHGRSPTSERSPAHPRRGRAACMRPLRITTPPGASRCAPTGTLPLHTNAGAGFKPARNH